MKIYLDLLFILNFIYDFLLLVTVSVTLKRKASLKRIILSSILGAFSTFIILIPWNKYIILVLNVLMGLFMLLVCFGYRNFKYFFNNLIYLYMTSVILAGFLYFLKIQFNNLSYLISLSIAPLILYLYVKEQKKLKEVVNYYKQVLITLTNSKTLLLQGFIDSGNKLKDPITNKNIILVNKNKLKGIYNIRSPMYVIVHTVNHTGILPCIKIKNITIDNRVYTNYLLGLSDDFKGFDEVDCLLNYSLLEE